MLFLGSTVQNFEVNKLADVINAAGGVLNVQAQVGQSFATLTWVTTVLALVGFVLTLWEKRRYVRGY